MEAFKTVIWIANMFASTVLIVLILMQQGKGAEGGAGLGGSGSAQGVFGSAGNANFLSRMTSITAMVFFATCLALGYIHSNSRSAGGIDFSTVQQQQKSAVLPSVQDTVQPASGAK